MSATIINFPRRKAREATREDQIGERRAILITELRAILTKIRGYRHDESKFLARIADIEAIGSNLRAGRAP